MKFLPGLIVASLAANVVLLLLPAPKHPELKQPSAAPAQSASDPSRQPGSMARSTAQASTNLSQTEPAQLGPQLAAAGLPPEAVAAAVKTRIFSRYEQRRSQLVAEARSRIPWWRSGHASSDELRLLSLEQRKELRDLEAASRSEAIGLLGAAAFDQDGSIARRYSYLTPEKAVLLDSIDRDYASMEAQLREEAGFAATTGDKSREAFLKAEKSRDVAALLTPQEKEDYDLRVSEAGTRVFQRARAFRPSEEEYRKAYAAMKSLEGRQVTTTGPAGAIAWEEAPEVKAVLRAALGDARFADWELSGHGFHRTLAAAAPSAGIPPTTVTEVARLLHDTTQQSMRIKDDKGLDSAQKVAVLAELTASVKAKVAAKIGSSAADSYLKNGVRWFSTMEQASAVELDGPYSTSIYSLSAKDGGMRTRLISGPSGGQPQ